MEPFLDLMGFQELWDGPPLTDAQQLQVQNLLVAASNWIYNRVPSSISPTDPTAQQVTYEVTANVIRYGKYQPLSGFADTVGHRSKSGSFDDPASALDFTDRHKQLLGIPLRANPIGCFRPFDFNDLTPSGWPTPWSNQYGSGGYYTYFD